MNAPTYNGLKEGLIESRSKTGWTTDAFDVFCKASFSYIQRTIQEHNFQIEDCIEMVKKHISGSIDAIKDAYATITMHAMYPMYIHMMKVLKCEDDTLYMAMESVYRSALSWSTDIEHSGSFYSYAYVSAKNRIISWKRDEKNIGLSSISHPYVKKIREYIDTHEDASIDQICRVFKMKKSTVLKLMPIVQNGFCSFEDCENYIVPAETDNIIDSIIHEKAMVELLDVIKSIYGIHTAFCIKYHIGPYVGCKKLNGSFIRDEYCKLLLIEESMHQYSKEHPEYKTICESVIDAYAMDTKYNSSFERTMNECSDDINNVVNDALANAMKIISKNTPNSTYKNKATIYRKINSVFPEKRIDDLWKKDQIKQMEFRSELERLGLYHVVAAMERYAS